MKYILKFVFVLAISTQFQELFSQSLEFVENKGQWDKSIQYKGDLAAGSFALTSSGGYKIMLYNKEDYSKIGNLIHHNHSSASTITNPIGGGGGGNDVKTFAKSSSTPKNTSDNGENIDLKIRGHVFEVKFINANPNPIVIPEKPIETYNNYFLGNDKSKWAGGCKIFNAVTYKNIYPNIDVRYYTNNGSLKYDFIIHAGGDASKILLYFDGVDGLKKNGNNQLIIKTSVEDIKEDLPYSYLVTPNGRKEVNCDYVVKGNFISYNIPQANGTSTLVIDPQYVFSTFSGSRTDNWGYSATYDAQGNLYGGGIVFGSGFPTSTGAFTTNFQGGNNQTGEGKGFDIGIIKFNPLGTNRIYATYIGGTGNEYPHSLVVDNNNNLIVAGRTQSTDYPTSTNTWGSGGGMDIIITKLNASGSGIIGSRLFGGSGEDGVNVAGKFATGFTGAITTRRNYGDDSRSEVIVDAANNIYVVSTTQSANFRTTPNATQTSIGIGSGARPQDAILLKTSPDISTVLFSSFLGGNGDDAGFVLALNPLNNNISVAGGTTSTDFPQAGTSAYQSSFQGGICDGFVAEFSNNAGNISLLRTSYFGTSGNDILFGIQYDSKGFAYIMGTTTGNWPVQNAIFSQTNSKQFIAKILPDMSGFVYSTIFGTSSNSPNISPTAFLVDRCENVYVSGWGGSFNNVEGYPNSGTFGLTVTPDRIQPRTDGNDFYFFVLKKNATAQLYGDFYGQSGGFSEHVDGGTSRFDKQGVIYQAVCANCNGGAIFPTTAGVWSPTNQALRNGGGGCNLATVKIAFNLAGVGANIQSTIKGVVGKKSGCVPLSVNFRDTIADGKSYEWNFGDGSPSVTTTTPNIGYTFNAVGDYVVRLVSFDPSTCNGSDTSYITIRARNNEANLSFINNKLPPCTALNYEFTNTSIAPPGLPFTNNSFNINFGDGFIQPIGGAATVAHSFAAAGTYQTRLILVDTNYCNVFDSAIVVLRVAPNVKAQFSTPQNGCAPYTAIINNTSLAGQDFFWDFGDNTTFVGADPPPKLYATIGSYTIKLRVVDPQTCNITDSTQFTINVNGKPTAAFTYLPNIPLANTPVEFINNSTGGAVLYEWEYGDGNSTITTKRDTIINYLYNISGTLNACLIAVNAVGCADTTCKPITAIVIPGVDVPNAFTPNGDGRNDKIFVRGFGVDKMNWNIYNRWGNLVFQSTTQANGWDGRYKGIIQPQDVYTFTLEVVFTDGQVFSKKGDITLLK